LARQNRFEAVKSSHEVASPIVVMKVRGDKMSKKTRTSLRLSVAATKDCAATANPIFGNRRFI
jgi:hypothetical protein